MNAAADGLKVSFPKMIHLTCLAHGFHRVTELIRDSFPQVNSLISNVKKIFKKSPSRISFFKEYAHGIPLPPEPIITRWGTWLEAVEYYANNYEIIKIVVNSFDKQDSLAIKNARKIFQETNLEEELIFITSNFISIKNTIANLESKGLKLTESIDLVEDQIQILKNSSNEIGKKVFDKTKKVIERNKGYKDILLISKILNGEKNLIQKLKINYTPSEIICFSYASITSCDVERTFSKYKSFLIDRRQRFTNENLKMAFVTYCNNDY